MANAAILSDLARLIATRYSNAPNGCTIDPRTRREPDLSEHAWLVSVEDYPKTFEAAPTDEDLLCWLQAPGLFVFAEGVYVGWYRDSESKRYVFDISLSVIGLGAVAYIGAQNKQKEIYHPATGRLVPLKNMDTLENSFNLIDAKIT